MKTDLIAHLNNQNKKKSVVDVKPGDTVSVHTKIVEGSKERIQVFEGVVIGVKGGKELNATFTVRKISNGIGVERVFPLHSPKIAKIEIKRRAEVRRAKLNYLKGLSTKKAKLKDKKFDILAVNTIEETEVVEAKVNEDKEEKIDAEITEIHQKDVEDEENVVEESVEEIAEEELKEFEEIHEKEDHTINDETSIAEEETEIGIEKAEEEDTREQG